MKNTADTKNLLSWLKKADVKDFIPKQQIFNKPKKEKSETMSFNKIAKEINAANIEKGFWDDEIALMKEAQNMGKSADGAIDVPKILRKAFNAQRIALMHSELSEALEADRKDLMDDKLKEFKGLDVELADTLIRIFDFCGFHNIDLDTIMAAKLAYNKTRPYKHGKSY